MKAASPAALLGAAAFVLYSATLSRQPSADSLLFALAVESAEPLRLVNLRHPLLHPLGWSFVQFWRLLGWEGRALPPLQVLNALAGAAAVALLYHVAARVTGSSRIAGAVAAGFAVSGAMWLLSTEAEFVTPALAANLLVFDLILIAPRQRWPGARFLLGTGMAIGVATLAYLSNASLLLVAAAAAHPGADAPWRTWLRRVTLLAVGAAVPVVSAGALLSYLVAGPAGWPAQLARLHGGGQYGQLGLFNLPHGAYAFVRSLLLYPHLGMNERSSAYLAAATRLQLAAFIGYYALAALLALGPLFWAVRRWPALRRAPGRTLALLSLWALQHAAFALYWVPGDMSFWVAVLAAWWLLVALLLATADDRRRALEAVAATAAVLLVVNAAVFILPRHDLRRNQRYWIANGVAAHTTPADVVVTASNDVLALYLTYFAQRAVVTADAGSTPRAVAKAVAKARVTGGRVFAVGLAPPAPAARFTVVPAWHVAGEPVWEVRQQFPPP